MKKQSVLFVCMGNICRSLTAHGVFRHKVREQGLAHLVDVDSAGTHNYHPDSPVVPDPYYGGKHGFEKVLDLVEDACDGLVRHVRLTNQPAT